MAIHRPFPILAILGVLGGLVTACPSPSPTPVYPPIDADAEPDACEIFARANTELKIALPDGGQRILLCDGGTL